MAFRSQRAGAPSRTLPERWLALVLLLLAAFGSACAPLCAQVDHAQVREYAASAMQAHAQLPKCDDPCCQQHPGKRSPLPKQDCAQHCVGIVLPSAQPAAMSPTAALLHAPAVASEPVVQALAEQMASVTRNPDPPPSFSVPLRI